MTPIPRRKRKQEITAQAELIDGLSLALQVASITNARDGIGLAWGNPSPFQDEINKLLVKVGRTPVEAKKVTP
jgi:hypothetical protein